MNTKEFDNKPRRVLHVVGSMGIGGIQSFITELYRHIDRSCIQFDFLIHKKSERGYEDEIRNMGGQIFYQESFSLDNVVNYIGGVESFLNNHPEYQIIHIHMRTVASVWCVIARKKDIITVVHSHSTTNGYGFRGVLKNFIQVPVRFLANYYMGCSVAANEWMFGKRIAHSERCIVLKNGINTEKFKFDEKKRRKIRKELDIADDEIVLGNVGRLVEQKNQIFLIDLIENMYRRNNKYRLVIAGDGPLHDVIANRIAEEKLQKIVYLLGSRSDVPDLLSAFDIFVMPSKNEGLGIAAIEAQTSGLTCLVSNTIPMEVCVSPNIKMLPINQINLWLQEICGMDVQRNNACIQYIKEAGYDIKESANILSVFYESVLMAVY